MSATRPRLALAALAGLAVAPFALHAYRAWAQPPSRNDADAPAARLRPTPSPVHPMLGGFGGGREAAPAEPARPPVVYIVPPVSAKAAKTWEKLQQPIAFAFPNETPLEDVIKYLKSATQSPKEKGISIYVDPVSLQEAEKTMTSPVTIDLEDVPISLGLELILKQLGLTFTVQQDGVVMIVSEGSDGPDTYPSARILDELAQLRGEVAHLRKVVESSRQGHDPRQHERQLAELLEQVEIIRKAVSAPRHERPQTQEAPKGGGER